MTVISMGIKVCGICGHKGNGTRFMSFASIGRTLDGHDLPLTTDPVRHEVDRCMNCGFCSTRLYSPGDVTMDDLRSPEYRQLLERGNLHECAAYLLSIKGRHRDAAYMYLHGAWVSPKDGVRLRSSAIKELRMSEPTGDDIIVMADMLRCVGDFDQSSEIAYAVLSSKGNIHQWGRAKKELELIAARDISPTVFFQEQDDRAVMHVEVDEDEFTELTSSEDPHLVTYRECGALSQGDCIVVRELRSDKTAVFTIINKYKLLPAEYDEASVRTSIRVVSNCAEHIDTKMNVAYRLHLSQEKPLSSWPCPMNRRPHVC